MLKGALDFELILNSTEVGEGYNHGMIKSFFKVLVVGFGKAEEIR